MLIFKLSKISVNFRKKLNITFIMKKFAVSFANYYKNRDGNL